MPDLRYHVVSLVSVFFALAVGVLLGIAMADNGVLDEQLKAQVSGIRADLDGQRARLNEKDKHIDALEKSAAEDDAMLIGLSDAIIADRLDGTSVAMVRGPYADEGTTRALKEALALSGASLTSVTELEPPQAADREASTQTRRYADEAAGIVAPGTTTGGVAPAGPVVVVFLGGGDPPPGAGEGAPDALASPDAPFLLVDADLGPSAARLSTLLEALGGEHPTAVAAFPDGVAAREGFGLVKGFARRAIARRSGFAAREPLSGQRALLPQALRALPGIAPGFGAEVGMTLDLLAAGITPLEIPLALDHRPTGKTPSGFAHRARQGADVL